MLFFFAFVGKHIQHVVLHLQADARIPITAVSKKFICQCGCKGQHTWHAIFKVIVWSFRMLLLGYVFDYLPENEVWEQERCRLASGTKLAGHALVLQCRGDWPFLKQLLLGNSLENILVCSGDKLLRGLTPCVAACFLACLEKYVAC